jgi:hypothetical protein
MQAGMQNVAACQGTSLSAVSFHALCFDVQGTGRLRGADAPQPRHGTRRRAGDARFQVDGVDSVDNVDGVDSRGGWSRFPDWDRWDGHVTGHFKTGRPRSLQTKPV